MRIDIAESGFLDFDCDCKKDCECKPNRVLGLGIIIGEDIFFDLDISADVAELETYDEYFCNLLNAIQNNESFSYNFHMNDNNILSFKTKNGELYITKKSSIKQGNKYRSNIICEIKLDCDDAQKLIDKLRTVIDKYLTEGCIFFDTRTEVSMILIPIRPIFLNNSLMGDCNEICEIMMPIKLAKEKFCDWNPRESKTLQDNKFIYSNNYYNLSMIYRDNKLQCNSNVYFELCISELQKIQISIQDQIKKYNKNCVYEDSEDEEEINTKREVIMI